MKYTFLLLFFFSMASNAQKIELLTEGTPVSIRGLSVVSDLVVWVSGSNGRVGRSLDGGASWTWTIVKGFEKRDFRDIEAFDKDTAIIMAISEPANILKTIDGGETWKQVYENKTKGMFLDAMEFFNHKTGIVIGDPLAGKFFMAKTTDYGNSWQELPVDQLPVADSGEACFASSGTNIRKLHDEQYCFISGGMHARYFSSGQSVVLPIVQGKTTTGANSLTVWSETNDKGKECIVVVGGDFAADSVKINNCVFSKDAGKSWQTPAVSPHGYRSCVEFITGQQLITCGTSGVDISTDSGMNWKLISSKSFHVCRKAKNGNAVFLAGGGGRIAKLGSND